MKQDGKGVEFERIRRITGYLSSTNQWNDAKLQELQERVTHNIGKQLQGIYAQKSG